MTSANYAAAAKICDGACAVGCIISQVLSPDELFCDMSVCVFCVCWCSSWTLQWTQSAARRTSSPRWASMVWWRCPPSPQARPCRSPNTSVPSVVTAPQVSDIRLWYTPTEWPHVLSALEALNNWKLLDLNIEWKVNHDRTVLATNDYLYCWLVCRLFLWLIS